MHLFYFKLRHLRADIFVALLHVDAQSSQTAFGFELFLIIAITIIVTSPVNQ